MPDQFNRCTVCSRANADFIDIRYTFCLRLDRICPDCYYWMDAIMVKLGYKEYSPMRHATFVEYFDLRVATRKRLLQKEIDEELKNMTLEKAQYMHAHHGFDLWGHLSGFDPDKENHAV